MSNLSLHTEVMCWLRYVKQMPIVCTEVGNWNADVIGLSIDTMIEVEVKVSYADFLADFKNKKAKHFTYFGEAGKWDYGNIHFRSVPNHFFFAVEDDIADKCKSYLEGINHPAGLIARYVPATTGYRGGRSMSYLRRPKRLKSIKPDPQFMKLAIARMGSQICGYAIKADLSGTADSASVIERTLRQRFRSFDFTGQYDELMYRGKAMCTAMGEDWDTIPETRKWQYIAGADSIREFI